MKFSEAISSIWLALAVELAPEERRDVGVVLGEPAGPQALELLGRHCHGGEC